MARDNQTTVKQRAARIPLDYFQRKSVLERSKQWLAIAAVLGGIGYVVWSAFGGPAVVKHYSPGKLSAAHAMWGNRCDACHQSFVPLTSTAWTTNTHAADALCQNCHSGAVHSNNQIVSEVASCAACHQEHRGNSANIVRSADSSCTVCHANIASHLKPDAKPIEPPLANVTSFLTDHPEFRSANRSSSQIKFSHSRHMRPGVTFGLGPMTLKDLSAADRKRYQKRGQTEDDPVTLECASCHQLDAASTGVASLRSAGDYMLPIQFDQHCAACHGLTIEGPAKLSDTGPEITKSTRLKSGDRVPHGLEGEELAQFVNQLISAKLLNSSSEDLRRTPPGKAVGEPLEKWRLPNWKPQPGQQASTVGEFLTQETKAATGRLRLQCTECHAMSSEAELLKVQPVEMRPAWFQHAKFDHAAHRAVSCESCHGGAFPAALPSEPTAMKTLDSGIFIPGRKLCLECHSPARGEGNEAQGGARFDCVECHRYHNGDEPWHGRGATARGAKDRLQIEDFINGESWKGKKIAN